MTKFLLGDGASVAPQFLQCPLHCTVSIEMASSLVSRDLYASHSSVQTPPFASSQEDLWSVGSENYEIISQF